MNPCFRPIGGLVVLCCLSFVPACGSSKGKSRDGAVNVPDLGSAEAGSTLADKPATTADTSGTETKDAPTAIDMGATDRPLSPADTPPTGFDGSLAVMDTPRTPIDGSTDSEGPGFDGGPRADARFITRNDGRLLQVVDYCLPILPLPTEFGSPPYRCPATVDDAIADERNRGDASLLRDDAHVYRCSEGWFAYFAYNLGGIDCFYSPESRKLISVVSYTDTYVQCGQSDTVSMVPAISGQVVTCTGVTSTAVDGGVDRPPSPDLPEADRPASPDDLLASSDGLPPDGLSDSLPVDQASTISVVPLCIPGQSVGCACTDGRSGAQVCSGEGTFGPCVCTGASTIEQQILARVSAGIVGSWTGTVRSPWEPVHNVTFAFTADGHYSAHCQGGCVALYYGDDGDSPSKTYRLLDVNTAGEVSGEIEIYYGSPSTDRDQLLHVVLSADGNTLSFEMWHALTYGPVSFTLHRAD